MKTDINSEKFSKRLEMFIAIILGLTALLTAYASWQSSLYDGNQAELYTNGNATIADANQMYNEASQLLGEDMDTWNDIANLQVDKAYAEYYGQTDEAEKAQYKIDQIMYNNVSDEFAAAVEWANAQEDYASPFDMEGYALSYYNDAKAEYDKGVAKINEGTNANNLGDRLGLVTVVFAVVLFMLGIVSTFKNNKTKLVVMCVSLAALVFGVVVMLGIPYVALN